MRTLHVVVTGFLVGWSASLLGCSGEDDDASRTTGKNAGSGGTGGSASAGAGGASAGKGEAGSGGRAEAGGSAGSGGSGAGGAAGRDGPTGGTASGSGGRAGAGEKPGDAPPSAWVNATGNLAGIESECGNLTIVSATPGSETVIAGVAKLGLFASTDRGTHWSPLGVGPGSATITNRPSAIVYDPEDAALFWESGIYNGGGVYKTTDDGETFARLGDVAHDDLVSVDFTDPDRKTLLVGGHEQKQTLYLSTNGGESFENIGQNLPSDSHFSSSPLVLDAETFLLGSCGYGDGACGVYRSTDAGEHWDRASDLPVAGRPLLAADGTIYWSLLWNGGMARSSDGGSTWTKVADNLVTGYPVELPDGRILSLRGSFVVVSADQGESWSEIGEEIPFEPSGVTYSLSLKTLFVWHWDCGNVVLEDAIVSAGFDYDE